MQPWYLYYYRNMTNPPYEDKNFINKLIEESIKDENTLIKSYEILLKKDSNQNKTKILEMMISDATIHIKILKIIYGNLNNQPYNDNKDEINILDNFNDIAFLIIKMSKKYRKILYSMESDVHRYMLFDIIIDNVNNLSLLSFIRK